MSQSAPWNAPTHRHCDRQCKAKIGDKVVTGELDFYIRNCNNWALKLLRDGSGLREHLSRIPGKYRNVEATQWLVVDCRLKVVPRKRETDLCTLVFDDGYKSCQCFMRSEEPVTINLAE